MPRRIAPHRAHGAAPARIRAQAGSGDEPSGRQARGRQVDQVVEPGRRPAERRVARCAVADHAVGRVDRLVERDARQAAQAAPEAPAPPRRRKNSRPGSRSPPAAPPASSSASRVAADDVRDRRASAGQPVPVQRPRPPRRRGGGSERWASKVLAIAASNGKAIDTGSRRSSAACRSAAEPPATTMSASTATAPAHRRWQPGRRSSFSLRSSRAISHPSQTTGCRIARNSHAG